MAALGPMVLQPQDWKQAPVKAINFLPTRRGEAKLCQSQEGNGSNSSETVKD